MTKEEQNEYSILWRDHGCTLTNPHSYVKTSDGHYYEHVNKYVWQHKDDFHPAEKVERLRVLAAMKEAA